MRKIKICLLPGNISATESQKKFASINLNIRFSAISYASAELSDKKIKAVCLSEDSVTVLAQTIFARFCCW